MIDEGGVPMATIEPKATRSLEREHPFLLRAIGWEGYEALLRMIGDGPVRVTYDQGDAELRSPSQEHGSSKRVFDRFVCTVTEELQIPIRALGSSTSRRRERDCGLEADDCYDLSNVARARGKGHLDTEAEPPPDLAIDVEITRGLINRLGVYAKLGVAEVWRFDGAILTIHALQADGSYATVPESPGLPMLAADEVARWVHEGEAADDHSAWGRRLRAWVRDVLVPRSEGLERK